MSFLHVLLDFPIFKLVPCFTPNKIVWFDKTFLTIFKKCEVSLQLHAQSKRVCYNVLPMDVVHILLGCPQLYDKNVTNLKKDNTYVLIHNEKRLAQLLFDLHNIIRPKKRTPKSLHSRYILRTYICYLDMNMKHIENSLSCSQVQQPKV